MPRFRLRTLPRSLLLRGAATALLAVGFVPACSSAGTSAPAAQPAVYGDYVASGDLQAVGDISEIVFEDSQSYTLYRTTGSEDVDVETGTYVVDATAGTLALTDSSTGSTETIPYAAGEVSTGAPVGMSDDPLHVLGGGLTGSGGSLTSGSGWRVTVQPLCSFTSKQLNFQSTSVSGCPLTKSASALTSAADGGTALTKNGACPPLVFHSFTAGGTAATIFATIKTVPSATTTAAYAVHLPAGASTASVPQCFIDTTSVVDGLTGAQLGKGVKVSEHYTLAQLTQTGSSPDRYVVLDNQSVRALEAFVSKFGVVPVVSGFRGPVHQSQTCESQCGAISCCGRSPQQGRCQVTCAKTSRHLFGKAFDLPSQYLSSQYIQGACNAGFSFVYNESNHLHIDTSFPAGTCQKVGLK